MRPEVKYWLSMKEMRAARSSRQQFRDGTSRGAVAGRPVAITAPVAMAI
jgi:hypothetical protein